MKLQVLQSKAIKLSLERKDSNLETKFELDYLISYDTTENNIFSVVFNIEIVQKEGLQLKTEFITWFRTSEIINEQFKKSDFPTINAPAIAFPFLRSFISVVSLNAGYSAILLPSINFIQLSEKRNIRQLNK